MRTETMRLSFVTGAAGSRAQALEIWYQSSANLALMPLALVYISMLPTVIKEKVVLHHQNSL